MSDYDLYYFAGLMDGEGHFGLQTIGNPKRKAKNAVVQLAMTSQEAVGLFSNFFGLEFREVRSPSIMKKIEAGKCQRIFVCRTANLKAYRIAKILLPYLIVKGPDAKAIVDLYEKRVCVGCGNPIPPEKGLNTKNCSIKCRDSTGRRKRRAQKKRPGVSPGPLPLA